MWCQHLLLNIKLCQTHLVEYREKPGLLQGRHDEEWRSLESDIRGLLLAEKLQEIYWEFIVSVIERKAARDDVWLLWQCGDAGRRVCYCPIPPGQFLWPLLKGNKPIFNFALLSATWYHTDGAYSGDWYQWRHVWAETRETGLRLAGYSRPD